jgi:glutamine synthetase
MAANPEVKYLDVLMHDLNGIIRGKRVDLSQIKKLYTSGFQFPSSCVLLDVTGENTGADGRGFEDGDPDGTLVPIPGTLVKAPWLGCDAAQVLCTFVDDENSDTAFEDPRNVLAHVVSHVRAAGLNPVTACELEFYLLDTQHGPDGSPQPPKMPKSGRIPAGGQVYSMDEIDQFSDFFRDVADACDIQGIPAGPASAEYAAGQFEINLNHVDDPIVACDHSALLQRVIRGVAIKHGFEATFMAKPALGATGNGLHIHCSLLDDDGVNIFDNGGPEGSDLLRHAIGGMLATMAEGMAFFAPNINSYRRFEPDAFVPTCRAWSYNNRSTALRVPGGDAMARRFEHRIAGADANPYLTMAVMLSGALHGLNNKIEPPDPATENVSNIREEGIPTTWQQGLDSLETAAILPRYMGEVYCNRYRKVKQFEIDRFTTETISPKEYEWYLLSR